MLKRIFDITFSAFGILLLSPILVFLYFLVALTSRGGGIYKQKRIGLHEKPFQIYKFRTMYVNSDYHGLITIGKRDPRVTFIGYFLRKFKLDEIPQLFNVLFGDMSLVGPRPEVPMYVSLYSDTQKKVLEVRPGITDYASILFINENEYLEASVDPQRVYIDEILPRKIELNLKYIENQSIIEDIRIIFRTIFKVFDKSAGIS